MLRGNANTTSQNSNDSFKQIISEARVLHQRSKDGAAEAAANTYMLWLSTQPNQATKEASAWIKKEIELVNETIASHNDDVKKKQERANKFKAGTLPDDDAVNEKPRNAAHAAEIEKMREELRQQAQWDKKAWTKLRKVPVEARDGASPFTEIVKFVFQFNEVQHSDQVARYSLVLEWVRSHFGDNAPKEKDEVVTAIRNFGGFEEALYEQRRIKSGEEDDSDDRRIMSDAIREDIKHALGNTNPIATIDHEARFEKEGFVMFLGRKSGGQVSLVVNWK